MLMIMTRRWRGSSSEERGWTTKKRGRRGWPAIALPTIMLCALASVLVAADYWSNDGRIYQGVSAGSVDVEVSAADDLDAVGQIEPHASQGPSPDDGTKLRPIVFQRQVAVPRLRPGQVGDLAGHPDCGKRAFQELFDPVRQLPNRKWSLLVRTLGKQFVFDHAVCAAGP